MTYPRSHSQLVTGLDLEVHLLLTSPVHFKFTILPPLHPICQGKYAILSFLNTTKRFFNLASIYIRRLRLNFNDSNVFYVTGTGECSYQYLISHLYSKTPFRRRQGSRTLTNLPKSHTCFCSSFLGSLSGHCCLGKPIESSLYSRTMARGLTKSPQISCDNIIIPGIVKTYLVFFPKKHCVRHENTEIGA